MNHLSLIDYLQMVFAQTVVTVLIVGIGVIVVNRKGKPELVEAFTRLLWKLVFLVYGLLVLGLMVICFLD